MWPNHLSLLALCLRDLLDLHSLLLSHSLGLLDNDNRPPRSEILRLYRDPLLEILLQTKRLVIVNLLRRHGPQFSILIDDTIRLLT